MSLKPIIAPKKAELCSVRGPLFLKGFEGGEWMAYSIQDLSTFNPTD